MAGNAMVMAGIVQATTSFLPQRPITELVAEGVANIRAAVAATRDAVENARAAVAATRDAVANAGGAVAATRDAIANVRENVAVVMEALLPNRPIGADLLEATNMVTGHGDEGDRDLSREMGRNQLNVVLHLQDLATGHLLNPRVTQARQEAQGDPERLVMNLLALCKEKPPVLSRRPGSAAQPD